MPILEFECKKCNHTQEELQKFDDPRPSCHKCGLLMERKTSLCSFRLKGTGGWVGGKDNNDSENK